MNDRMITPDEARRLAVPRDEWFRSIVRDQSITRTNVLRVAHVYWTHASYSPDHGPHGRTRPAWPAQGKIAAELGIEKSTVSEVQKELVDRGYLTCADRKAYIAYGVSELEPLDARVNVFVLTLPQSPGPPRRSKRDTQRANHTRWHVNRNRAQEGCLLCFPGPAAASV